MGSIRGYAHSGIIHATNSVLQARCAMRFAGRCLFLAHPRQILTQSFEDRSTRLVAGTAQLFYAKVLVALPFSSGFPSFSRLACLLASLQHSPLLVAARCRHSLRHRFSAGLTLRSLTDCFISTRPISYRSPSRAASQYQHSITDKNKQDQTPPNSIVTPGTHRIS